MVKLDDGLFAEDVEIRRVDIRFGWDASERPYCRKCRLPTRPVDAGEGVVVWITESDCEREPCCSHTTLNARLADEEVVAQMFHEPDRSVASWCHGAAIHVDDGAGTVRLLARTECHNVAVELRPLPDGGVSVRRCGGAAAAGGRRRPDAPPASPASRWSHSQAVRRQRD